MENKPNLLTIKDLHASIEGKEILKGLNLEIRPGEVHAIMGPMVQVRVLSLLCLQEILLTLLQEVLPILQVRTCSHFLQKTVHTRGFS